VGRKVRRVKVSREGGVVKKKRYNEGGEGEEGLRCDGGR
jgi:hypothetical protein